MPKKYKHAELVSRLSELSNGQSISQQKPLNNTPRQFQQVLWHVVKKINRAKYKIQQTPYGCKITCINYQTDT